MNVAVPIVRYRLGAEELIELGGSARASAGNEPFLANRGRQVAVARTRMGDIVDDAVETGVFITRHLGLGLVLLEELSPVPFEKLLDSEKATAEAMKDLLDHAPSIGVLLAQILLLGSAVLAFGFALPDQALQGLENLLRGIGTALAEKGVPPATFEEAKAEISVKASPGLVQKIQAVLDAASVRGSDPVLAGKPRESAPSTPPLAGAEMGAGGLGTAASVGLVVLTAGALALYLSKGQSKAPKR